MDTGNSLKKNQNTKQPNNLGDLRGLTFFVKTWSPHALAWRGRGAGISLAHSAAVHGGAESC